MPKFAAVAILAVLVTCAHGFPTRDSDIAAAAAAGNWDEVRRVLGDYYKEKYQLAPLNLDSMNVKDFKPPPGGHFYGEAEYTYHAATSDNGKVNEQSAGHKVVNNDGQVTEFDFKPPRPKF